MTEQQTQDWEREIHITAPVDDRSNNEADQHSLLMQEQLEKNKANKEKEIEK